MKNEKYIPKKNDLFTIDKCEGVMKCLAVNHKGVAFEIICSNDESDIGVYDSVPVVNNFSPVVSLKFPEDNAADLVSHDANDFPAFPLSSLASEGWRVEPGQIFIKPGITSTGSISEGDFKINSGESISVDEVDKKIASLRSETQSQIVALRDSIKLNDIRLSRLMQDIKYLFDYVNLQPDPNNDLIEPSDKKPMDKYIPEIGHFFTVSHIGKFTVPILYECTGVIVSSNMPEFTQQKTVTGKSLMRGDEHKVTDSDEVIFIRLNKDGSMWEE